MAKNQEALLQEVVGQLRMLNKSSMRDRLRESEEAKRAEKLAEVTTDTQGTTGAIIDSATDFQRRYLAGQAKTFTDKALSNKPTSFEQDRQGITLNAVNFQLETIKLTLGSSLKIWQELLAMTKTGNDLQNKELTDNNKFRLDQLRAANEARLESIRPALAGVGGAGVLALPDKTGEGEGEGEGGGISAFGASGLTLAALAVWKKIKLGMKFIFGLPGKIGFALKSAGKLIFAKFLATKSGKPFLKNIGRIRAWPIILAAMVANSFYTGIKGAFSDDETGGNPNQDTDSAENQSLLDKVLDNKVFNTAMNAYLGFSVANFLTKGKLGASVAAVATAAWQGMKNTRLGGALLNAMRMAGGAAGLGLSAPAWAAMIAAGLVWYHWDSISSALKTVLLDPPATEPELLDAAALVGGDFDIGLSEQALNMDALSDVDEISEAAIKKIEMQEKREARKLKRQYLLKQSLLKKKANQGRHTFTAKDSLGLTPLLTEQLLANVSGMQGALRNVVSSMLDSKDGDSIVAPYLNQSARIREQEMQGAQDRFNKRISGDGIFTNNAMGTASAIVTLPDAMGTASGNVTIAPVNASTTSTIIQNYNAYEPILDGDITPRKGGISPNTWN